MVVVVKNMKIIITIIIMGPATQSLLLGGFRMVPFMLWASVSPMDSESPGAFFLLAGHSAPQLPASYANSFGDQRNKICSEKIHPSYRKVSYPTASCQQAWGFLNGHEHHIKAHALYKACWGTAGT